MSKIYVEESKNAFTRITKSTYSKNISITNLLNIWSKIYHLKLLCFSKMNKKPVKEQLVKFLGILKVLLNWLLLMQLWDFNKCLKKCLVKLISGTYKILTVQMLLLIQYLLSLIYVIIPKLQMLSEEVVTMD